MPANIRIYRTGTGAAAIVLPPDTDFDIPEELLRTDDYGSPVFDYLHILPLALKRPARGPGSHFEGPRFYVPACLATHTSQRFQQLCRLLFGSALYEAIVRFLRDDISVVTETELDEQMMDWIHLEIAREIRVQSDPVGHLLVDPADDAAAEPADG